MRYPQQQPDRPARVPMCRPTEFVSRSSGRSFFTGFMGGAKLIMVADPEADPGPNGQMVYTLFAEEAPNGLRPAKPRAASAGAPLSARPAGTSTRNAQPTSPTTSTAVDPNPAGVDGDDPPW